RCCTRVLQTVEAEGTTVRPTTALPPGVVYWRMFGRRAGVTGSRASYTWEFEVRRRDTPVDSSWGTIRDFTGDGYDDLLMISGEFNADGTTPLYVVEGGPGGPTAPRVLGALGAVPSYGRPRIGDFDGDGRADFAYVRNDSGTISMHVVQSGRGAALRDQRLSYATISFADISAPTVVDWDGDGYSDLVTTVFFRWPSFWDIAGSVLVVYRGSPSGLSLRPQEVTTLPSPIARPWVQAGVELTDVDLDGFGDIFVSDRTASRSEYVRFVLHRRVGGSMQAEVFPTLPGPSGLTSDVMYPMNIGDVDGDGLGDLALRLRDYGTFYLYRQALGRPASFAVVSESPPAGGDLDFGAEIEGADLNGDGLSDVMVRSVSSTTEAWLDSGLPYNSGRMYVYFGGRDGLVTAPIWFDRVRPTDPMDNPRYFAAEIASPGDLNADGIDDAAVVDPSRDTCCYVMGSPGLVGAHLGGCTPIPGAGFRVF
ncbi:MAG: VCBS repeat-containing protein, partial [Rhodoglobus sp.]|nr:VCBS repeat-containing protein [Rhodoglobus sp.]